MNFETTELNSFMGAIHIPLPEGNEEAVERLLGQLARGKTLVVKIEPKKERRTLTANAALWKMLGDMAKVLKTTAEELYLQSLQKYGISEYISCVPEAVGRVSSLYRIAIDRGPFYVSGNRFTCLQVYPGSSTYSTKEFSDLLDGVIQDAKELGVDFVKASDKALLLEERERDNAKAKSRMD